MLVLKLCLAIGISGCVGVPSAQSSEKLAPQVPAQSSPERPGVYHPGGDVSIPKLLRSVDPTYTGEARRKKLNGHTVLSIVVDTDGRPRDIQVVRSLAEEYTPEFRSAAEGLDKNAVKAVEKFRFQPSMLKGKAVPVSIRIEMNFKLF